ncbi:MAG: cellulase family glycosylhydrolase [Fibromonadaceae bacterium]|jgi:hypothetical protein|nr:cellulase family glycosylhydrolase [Fibromonadaceae bacterium]
MRKNVFLVVLFMLAQMANAAPELVVDGTQLKYKGKKIFFSGINLAWINYNSDVGAEALDETKWRKAVKDVKDAGGNAIRWWLFNNMSISPTINQSTHRVTGLPANTINNMKKALDIAAENGVMVSMCLFSHNLMESNQWGNYNGKIDITANKALFSDNAAAQAFIDNALIPVVKAIGNHPALMTWELFNEPEGMIANGGWTAEKISIESIVNFSEKLANAIHNNVSGVLVSTGIHCASDLQYWKSKSWLDFLQLHFYPEHQGTAENPFDHPFSFWSLNKPLIIGEFSAAGWNKERFPAYKVSTKTPEQLYKYAYENGYAGALSWDYGGFNDDVAGNAVTHNFAAAKPGIQSLANQYGEYINLSGYTSNTSSSSKASSSSAASSSSKASSSSMASSSSGASSSSTVSSSSSVAVSSSSSGTGSSSSSESNADTSSSSSEGEDVSPILHSQLSTLNSSTNYYTIKGEPLGNAKPQKAGVYIVKQGNSVKKIVVR